VEYSKLIPNIGGNVKAVLLAGGLGTRLREETEFKPKPMVEIGGKPVVWHIMKNLAESNIRDFVIATGETHSVREFCDEAFKYVGLNYEDYVRIDPKFYRPAEVHVLIGNSTKAHNKLGWYPEISFEELVGEMVEKALNK
jgi:CTP:phosphocholine cytidylyltransferase-like protein